MVESTANVGSFVLFCALAVALVGCGTATQGEERTETSQQSADTTLSTSPTEASRGASTSTLASEAVELTGLVKQPATLTVADLQKLPTETADVSFGTHEGTEQHTYRGVRLSTVIDQAGLQLDSDPKNDRLRKYVLVSAKDGYGAVVSWGEIDPEYTDAPILLAWEEDGQPLTGKDGPVRLVVATDKQGGRYVSGVVRIDVQSAGN